MNDTLPTQFLDKCSEDEKAEAETWWANLSHQSQSEVAVLLDTRNESCAFVFASDHNGEQTWHTLPIDDELVPEDPHDDDEWITDLVHYQLNHEEFVITASFVIHTFHICTQHPAAHKVLAEGKVSCDFECPVNDKACPIRNFASKIRHATLLSKDPKSDRTTWICR